MTFPIDGKNHVPKPPTKYMYIYIYIMSVKQCHKPPIWEWFIPPRKMVMTWGLSIIVLPTLQHIVLVLPGFALRIPKHAGGNLKKCG
jgi:hypothetical protein